MNSRYSAWFLQTACVLFMGALPLAAQGDSPSPELKRLLDAVNPKSDDWRAELLETDVSQALSGLKAYIESKAEWPRALILSDAKGSDSRPSSFGAGDVGRGFWYRELQVSASKQVSLRNSIDGLRLHFDAASELRVKFKVIGLDVGASQALVRIEIAGERDGTPVQMVGRFSVEFSVTNGKDATLCLGQLSWVKLTVAGSQRPFFVERTAEVLTGGGRLLMDMARGALDHAGVSDTVGEPIFMGHNGIAVGDINGDHRPDLYVAMPTGLPNRLLIQQADGTVVDQAAAAGVAWLDDTKGCLIADLDNDGDQDLSTAVGSVILIAWNDGKGRMDTYTALRAPTPAAYYSLSASDFDGDGDLDIYGTRYVRVRYGESIPLPLHDARNGPSNQLWRNDGEKRWVDVTDSVGLDVGNDRFSLAATWADVDGDGDEDLYVANDFGRNVLYRNDAGRFRDISKEAGVEDQAAGMGVSFGDVDSDGDIDIHVTNMFSSAGRRIAYSRRFDGKDAPRLRDGIRKLSLGNSLFLNEGKGTFADHSSEAGIRMGRWGWGAELVDINGDGLLDIVGPNGFLTGDEKDDL